MSPLGPGSKPINPELGELYPAPVNLELPTSESMGSIGGSSASSGRSSPSSSLGSTSAGMESEGDIARLAENLALKSDVTGHFHPINFHFSEAEACPDAPSLADQPRTLFPLPSAPTPSRFPTEGRKPPPSPLAKLNRNSSGSQSSNSSTPTAKNPNPRQFKVPF